MIEMAREQVETIGRRISIMADRIGVTEYVRQWLANDALQRQRIAQLEARLAESEKAAYDIDETIQHQKQRIAELEAEVARLQEELNDL